MSNVRVLVSDKLSEAGLSVLREAPGVELLSDDQLDTVLATLERDPVAPVSFPFVEHRPWVMVRGVQPG